MGLITRLRRARRDERGNQIVELALAVPVLLMLAGAATPILLQISDQITLNRAVAAGARYAAKVDAKPSTPDPGCPGTLGRRRNAQKVQEFVRDASNGLITDLTAVEVLIGTPGTGGKPCEADIGDRITVTALTTRDGGAVVAVANAALRLTGSSDEFPTTLTTSAQAIGYLE